MINSEIKIEYVSHRVSLCIFHIFHLALWFLTLDRLGLLLGHPWKAISEGPRTKTGQSTERSLRSVGTNPETCGLSGTEKRQSSLDHLAAPVDKA